LALLPIVALGAVAAQTLVFAVGRREATLAGVVGALATSKVARAAEPEFEPSGILGAVSGLVGIVLKPIYAAEAPLQAGSYDRAAVKARIEKDVSASPVVVYSYTLSPFCSQAKELLASTGAKVLAIELGPEWIPGLLDSDGAAVRAELGQMTGQTSMPHVFIGGKSVGGLFSGTPGLVPLMESGKLTKMLQEAGARGLKDP